MKFLTIRMKVTLWYAFFMLVLIAVSLGLISELSVKAMLSNQKEHLIEAVADGMDDIDSPSRFDYFDNGVYLLIYDRNETYNGGIMPDHFSVSLPLLNDYVQTVEIDTRFFYVYDKKGFDQTGTAYWMRGVLPYSDSDPIGTFIVSIASGFLPLLVLLTCVIGYFITRGALRPVKRIQETAQSIADNDELSLRIGLPEGKDEIARLGKTVDYMLDKLQRSFEKEKQFTDDVSHELRTPLAVILTESEYTLEHVRSLEEAKESMMVVNRQANKMTGLINQLLFFTRTDNGSFALNYEIFNVLPVVSELAEDYQGLTAATDIAISVIYCSEMNLKIAGDKMLFERCLTNIIQNAVDYSKTGGHIDITVSQNESYLTIAISDDGIGIHDQDLTKIWDRFYQVEASRNKQKGNGMGLGLAMVKTIVEKHGGYVTVESVPDKGSTFTLFFPLADK